LREPVPRLRRLAIMGDVSNHLTELEMAEVRGAASTLGLDVATFEIRRRRISRRPLRRSGVARTPSICLYRRRTHPHQPD
jgi:hypothetical protein